MWEQPNIQKRGFENLKMLALSVVRCLLFVQGGFQGDTFSKGVNFPGCGNKRTTTNDKRQTTNEQRTTNNEQRIPPNNQ